MRSIRISDTAYKFLSKKARADKRTITSTLDLLVGLFMEANYERRGDLEGKSISSQK